MPELTTEVIEQVHKAILEAAPGFAFFCVLSNGKDSCPFGNGSPALMINLAKTALNHMEANAPVHIGKNPAISKRH